LVLAKLGVLGGLKATTHFAATDIMNKIDPTINVDRSKRYYDNGKYVIAEGVSAGIDMSFYLLKRLFSEEVSDKVKKYIEYYPVKE
jgi:transcriptional regulator GlxA family with amidase domain